MSPKKTEDPTPEELQAILGDETPATPAPAPVPEPGQGSYNQFQQLIGALIEGMKGIAMSPESLKDILKQQGEITAELSRKARWPENPQHPGISAYSYPEGDLAHEKPKLSRETYFCGAREDEEHLTPGEILAYNAIISPKVCRGGAWRAEIIQSQAMGAKPTLHVIVPKDTVDQRMTLPSLHLILHELNGGPSTQDVMTLIQQIEQLKAALLSKGMTTAELEGQLLKA